MTAITILTCHTCGNQLEITPEIDRFACAQCGTEFVVRRGGGVITLVPMAEESQSRSRINDLRLEIEELQDDLWQRREGIPQDAVYNFFVLVDQVLHQRRGTTKKKSFLFGSRILSRDDHAKWEEDIKQTLCSLTVRELETMIEKCAGLIKKKVPMQHYVTQLQRLVTLKSELVSLGH